jgi:hypothetical protein
MTIIYIRLILTALVALYALLNCGYYLITGQYADALATLLYSGIASLLVAPSADQYAAWCEFVDKHTPR